MYRIASNGYVNTLTGQNYEDPNRCQVYAYLQSLSSIKIAGAYNTQQCVRELDITKSTPQFINNYVGVTNYGSVSIFQLILYFDNGGSGAALKEGTMTTGGGFGNGVRRTAYMNSTDVYDQNTIYLRNVEITASGIAKRYLTSGELSTKVNLRVGNNSDNPSTPVS